MLLKQLFEIGINGKLWRLLKSWYTDSPSRVRLNNRLSDAFLIGHGVKQGSVLFPSLFLKRRRERMLDHQYEVFILVQLYMLMTFVPPPQPVMRSGNKLMLYKILLKIHA